MAISLKPVLAGLFPKEIHSLLREVLGSEVPSFRARQICRWIVKGAGDFSEMRDLPEGLRQELAEKTRLFSSCPGTVLEDRDGTLKMQIILQDGNRIEAVILSDGEGRKTACLSTQAGCAGACVFCKTGALGFKRNLKAGEIVEEFLFLKQKAPEISHIVIMGMGEPLLNLDALRTAIDILCSKSGLNCSKRKITVSTSGITRGILDMAENGPQAELALSLTSARETLRNRLMPGIQGNSLAQIKEALRVYQKKQGRRITLEMVLLGGINTGEEEARALAAFASDLPSVVNLIPWNKVEGLRFEGKNLREPEEKEIESFRALLEQHGLAVTRRYRRGRSISGACGQLGLV